MLQDSVFILWPGQYLTPGPDQGDKLPGPGAGQSHLRLNRCNPGPEVVLQLLIRLQGHHWPWPCKTKMVE